MSTSGPTASRTAAMRASAPRTTAFQGIFSAPGGWGPSLRAV